MTWSGLRNLKIISSQGNRKIAMRIIIVILVAL
ncbi:MAG: hypothetical protein ACI87W_001584 [Halieaceae bacterium]|jgi:hypothetical protein